MISISAPSFDPDGTLVLYRAKKTDVGELTRRVARTATLDGGSAFVDQGFSESDRTIRVEVAGVTREEEMALQRMIRTYPRVLCGTHEGLFLGAFQRAARDDGDMKLTILTVRKLS